MDDADAILSFEDVSKSYGSVAALQGVSLRVEPGEIFALLGPNGAGKTTLIGCAAGLIQDFSGRIQVAGFDVRRDARVTRRLIGLVPQELNFDGFFTARQALYYQSGYYGIRPDDRRIEQVLRDFALLDKADTNTRRLSGGMKRRLMICKALMHDPAVLFLDEPTAGVDVELREELWRYVLRLREEGVTVVLTTHYLEEAEQLADRIGIIDGGRILLAQPRDSLLAELGRHWLQATFSGPVSADDFRGLQAEASEGSRAGQLRFEFAGASKAQGADEHLVAGVVDRARSLGVALVNVEAGRSSLEEVFRGLLKAEKVQREGETKV